jgi:hypothetical protein
MGSGDANDPYQIWDANDIQAIGADSNYWGAYFVLCADIDMADCSGIDYNIIGRFVDEDMIEAFTGVFDGKGHEISNFIYQPAGTNYEDGGLFGYVRSGTIKDLGLITPHINVAATCVGSLIAYLDYGGVVIDCYVEGGIVSGDMFVGGLIGVNRGTVRTCYAHSNVSGYYAGGLVGENYYGATSNCYSESSVIGNYAGGLVGVNALGSISNCYSTGSISASANIGGLVRYNDGSVLDSFWDRETSGQDSSAGGTSKTTVEMQDVNTFLAAGWDFTTPIWKMCNEPDYPRLGWEKCRIGVEIDIKSDVVNAKSKGKWISCRIWLPEGHDAGDINSESVVMEYGEGEVWAERVWFDEEEQVLMAKFGREAVCELIEPGEVELTVSGEFVDGTIFEGADTIQVMDKGKD